MKKVMISLSATMMLGAVSPFVTPTNAETSTTSIDSQLRETRNEISEVNEQIKKVDQAISDNRNMIIQTEEKIKSSTEELDVLQVEIAEIEERIKARNEILKERARMIQQEGGTISYVEVIFGASSFSDFINRVTAVTTILKADQDLLKEHSEDMQNVKEKKNTVEKKLAVLEETKLDLVGMQAQIKEQQAQNEALKAALKATEQNQLAEKEKLLVNIPAPTPSIPSPPKATSTPNKNVASEIPKSTPKPTGSIQTVITAGYKYIGNSVYVFGGGRTSYDIANGRFDCSAFVHWAFAQAGVSVGSTTDSLKNQGKTVSVSNMKPGDLVFFDTYKRDGHVGIYIGGGKFIGSQSSTGVAIANMTSGYWKDTFNGRVKRIM
ncbi:coiled-coil domain-containing protein [Fredinandcohnia humi]